MVAIRPTEDVVDDDGRTLRHVHQRPSGDTLVKAATVCGTHSSAQQVNDGAGFVDINITIKCILCLVAHAETVVGSGTEDLRISEIIYSAGDVDEHIAVILQLVTVTITRKSFSSAEDLLNRIVDFGMGIGISVRTDIDESIMEIGLVSDTTITTCSYFIRRIVLIIIITETATKDTPHPTLIVLHIRRNRMVFRHHCLDVVTNVVREIRTVCRQDAASQVVTAIDMVANPREAVLSHVGLRMAEDVGITAAGEGVEDTAIVEVDMGVTSDGPLKGATIDKLTLSHVGTIACSSSRHTGEIGIAVQIDISAVFLIIDVFSSFIIFSIFLLAADSTHLTATEDLEHITLVQVDGGTAPDL